MEHSILKEAYNNIKNNKFIEALICYKKFCTNYRDISYIVRWNINYCLSKITDEQKKALGNFVLFENNIKKIIYNDFLIEQIYVVSLKNQYIKRARFIREMNKYNLKINIIYGEDGKASEKSTNLLNIFKQRSYGNFLSTRHIDKYTLKKWKQNLGPEVFAYLLNQQKIFEDAIQHNYKKILVFDDDVYFNINAEFMLKNLKKVISNNYKILLLGASEYTNTNLEEFKLYKDENLKNLAYHPIPGNTCGSFAVIYDNSIYNEILNYIKEFEGPFDNATLGTIYLNYKYESFVAMPSICIPDVSTSYIRNNRNQNSHCLQMNWDITRYNIFMNKFHICLILYYISESLINDLINLVNEQNYIIDIFMFTNGKIEKIDITNKILVHQNIQNTLILNEIKVYELSNQIINNYDIVFNILYLEKISSIEIDQVICESMIRYNQNKIIKGKIKNICYLLNKNIFTII